jgi:rubrerythrin
VFLALTLDDVEWDRFDGDRVDPELVGITKAAALVEYNGAAYTDYLRHVFHDDPDFQAQAETWGREEVQHGEALGRWAKLADPSFDFGASFARFTDGYSFELDVSESSRGSRSGELIARCIVETGTSTFYTALARASDEPVLKQIAQAVAADEFRHYKMFYDALKAYLEREKVGRVGRLRAAMSRIGEVEDDELAYAYYAANVPPDTPYDRAACIRAYLGRVYGHYDAITLRRANSMVLKALGLSPNGWLNTVLTAGAHGFVSYRARKFQNAA